MIFRRSFLTGLTGVLAGLHMRPLWAQTTERLALRYGWDPAVAAPQTADIHVAPDGNDRSDGSAARPVRTVQRGVDLLATRRGGSLAIRGGLYRENVSLDALQGTPQTPYRIHRHGRDRVTITAAETLSGWQPCAQAEARAWGMSAEGLFVARLPASAVRHGALGALNLRARGQARSVAVDRADPSDPQATGDEATYHTADFVLNARKRIVAIRDPRLRGVPEQQMQGVEVLVYHHPNLVSAVGIAAFDPKRGEITLAKTDLRPQRRNKVPLTRYALRGAPWALGPDMWTARQTAPDQVSVYYRPRNSRELAQDIEVSLRPTCIDFGAARHVELFGIEALRAAGADRNSGICIRCNSLGAGARAGKGLRLVHCRVGETQSVGPRGFGALFMRGATDLVLQNVSVADVRGGFGLFLTGCTDVDARFLHITDVSNSPARFFTVNRLVLAFSLFEQSARDAHANKFNFYQGSDTVLVYGVRCRNVGGYVTYQKASRIHFAFCDFPTDPTAFDRALVSQNFPSGSGKGGADGSGDPVANATFYYWNNALTGEQGRANALSLGPAGNSQGHAFFNNILNGGGVSDIYTDQANPAREVRSHNRYTGLSFWQAGKFGWRFDASEEAMRQGARPRGQGRDMRPVIEAEIAALFPQFTQWSTDIDGRPVDWSRPPIGPQV